MKPSAQPTSVEEARTQLRESIDHKAMLQAKYDEIGEWDRKVAIDFCSSEERQRLSIEQQDLEEKIATIDKSVAELNAFLGNSEEQSRSGLAT
jgi:hypothetical protein